MKVGTKAKSDLGNLIRKNISEEFREKHMSGNLSNTVYVERLPDKVRVVVPARTYNMLKFQTQGVIVHTGNRSYASKLDRFGSEFYIYPFGTRKGSRLIKPHNHIGYVDKAIMLSIRQWMAKSDAKGRIKEI